MCSGQIKFDFSSFSLSCKLLSSARDLEQNLFTELRLPSLIFSFLEFFPHFPAAVLWLCPVHPIAEMVFSQSFHCFMLYHGYSFPQIKSHENGKLTACLSLPSFKNHTKSASFCSFLRTFRIFIFYL